MAAYRDLVYETPGFTDYFFAATPIGEIAELNIGSRPASRKATRRIEDLRAIPWVFSWGQCRVTLPGWYGFGSAIEAFLGEGRERTARAGAAAAHGARVAVLPHPALQPRHGARQERPVDRRALRRAGARTSGSADAIFARIRGRVASAPTTRSSLITGEKQRLASNPALARSIAHRFPYLDPLNHLQVELMRRYRAAPRRRPASERVQRGIHLSINGLAAGLRNTG